MLTVKQFQPGDPVRFIFLSRIHPKKQLNKLLEALSILFSNNPDQLWSLVVAGEGESDYIVQLKKLASDGGISEKISWTGHIDGEAKLQVLSSADWFILPSASENFGISAVEALSHGVPVIITREVGIANAVEEYGAGIISEADPYLLYQTLQSALYGPDPCMRTAARRLAHDRYSWQTIAKKLASFYNENIPMRKKS
jgi:glycosyltransferase involved in cell wall biosynthesis